MIEFIKSLTASQIELIVMALIVFGVAFCLIMIVIAFFKSLDRSNKKQNDQWGLLLDQIDNDPTRSTDRVYSTDTRLFQRKDSKGDPQILKN